MQASPGPRIRRIKRRVPAPTEHSDDHGATNTFVQMMEEWLPRINACMLALLWLVVLWSLAGRRGAIIGGLEGVTHDLQHVRETMQAQSHRQLKFNIHPRENGQVLRHPPHERDFIDELDLLSLQDYRLCCAWADKFICDEQRVRAEVQSQDGQPYLAITAFIGRVDAHCTFSWTAS